MKMLAPESGLVVWTAVSVLILLLMIAGLIHLLLNERIGRKESVAWILAIVFVPVFGSLVYFKYSRQHK
ncbi:PLDc N-terminal domain-containing protein [Flavisolibacter ginsenosidimutans]|uniref:Cardiolipin synthase N-terminal domain-containing protein n=1 Tax=Flavisolibacter ginsenosidimutans TaxID=661481 RepID=A0A5B8UEY3_9BACT|nr:PLDc N-terminal domain-containing protein [Flavisolibacter ginsenosidimutans]QEC55217.1 hypothetical protein FSB75_04620 [Flavisolibacter ginsenosidimutans]